MPSLIEELERDALNSGVPVNQLLQKCLVVGTKLKIQELVDWTRLELDGYKDKPVPEYRNVAGFPQVFNPVRGYQPLNFPNAELSTFFSTMPFNQPVSELEHALRQAEKNGSDGFHVSYSADAEVALRRSVRPIQLTPSLLVNISQYHKIVEGVRNAVLEWALQLEAAGVKGEGISFSSDEKRRALEATYNIATHIYGNVEHSQVGTATSAQQSWVIQVDTAKLREIVGALKDAVDTFGVDQQTWRELKAEIERLDAQATSPKPKVSIIKESIATARNILEGIVGNMAAAAILSQISNFKI